MLEKIVDGQGINIESLDVSTFDMVYLQPLEAEVSSVRVDANRTYECVRRVCVDAMRSTHGRATVSQNKVTNFKLCWF